MNLKILVSEGYMFYIVASNFLNVFGDFMHQKRYIHVFKRVMNDDIKLLK